MDIDYSFITTSFVGALTQEVVHWYDLRGKFGDSEVHALLRSPGYWIVTLLMIALSSLGAWYLFGEKNPSRDLQFLIGAAFPLILKKLVVTFSQKDKVNLGDSSIDSTAVYFEKFSFKPASRNPEPLKNEQH